MGSYPNKAAFKFRTHDSILFFIEVLIMTTGYKFNFKSYFSF